MSDSDKMSAADIAELIELRAGKQKVKDRTRRQLARTWVILNKATKQGITASEKEINDRLAVMKHKK